MKAFRLPSASEKLLRYQMQAHGAYSKVTTGTQAKKIILKLSVYSCCRHLCEGGDGHAATSDSDHNYKLF